jgi:DNA-binding NarL/FixJ family response regulator
MIRVLLAHPNPTLRSALALLLETRLDAQIFGQVSSIESLLCEAAATQPDLIIVALGLPGGLSKERTAALRKQVPRAVILATSTNPENAGLPELTDGFLCEGDPPETILRTILLHFPNTEAAMVDPKPNTFA